MGRDARCRGCIGARCRSSHLGICRSAAFALNLRPQCGHGTRSSRSEFVGGGGGKSLSGTPLAVAWDICRFACKACWNAWWSRFHLGILFAGIAFVPGVFNARLPGHPRSEPPSSPPPSPPPPPNPPPPREAVPFREARTPRREELAALGPRCGAGDAPLNLPLALSRTRCESHGCRCAELTVIFWQISKCTCSPGKRTEARGGALKSASCANSVQGRHAQQHSEAARQPGGSQVAPPAGPMRSCGHSRDMARCRRGAARGPHRMDRDPSSHERARQRGAREACHPYPA